MTGPKRNPAEDAFNQRDAQQRAQIEVENASALFGLLFLAILAVIVLLAVIICIAVWV